MLKLIHTFLLILGICSILSAQSDIIPKVPPISVLKTPEDFIQYQDKALELINWLESMPITKKNQSLRKPAEKFISKWFFDAPNIHPPIFGQITEPLLANLNQTHTPVLLRRALSAEVKYLIETNEIDPNELLKAAIKGLINAYKSISPRTKITFIDEFIKMEQNGTLDNWIDKSLADMEDTD